MTVSRRNFLRNIGLGTAVVVSAPAVSIANPTNPQTDAEWAADKIRFAASHGNTEEALALWAECGRISEEFAFEVYRQSGVPFLVTSIALWELDKGRLEIPK